MTQIAEKNLILLTKLDESPVIINLETVKLIESVPDTLIFFVNGDSLMVKETLDVVLQRTIEQRAKVVRRAQDLSIS